MIKFSELLGTWSLESWTIGYSDREDLSTPFGEEPLGLLLYTPEGWMSASIARADRPPLPPGTSPRRLPVAARAAAYSSYFHYAGRFQVVDGDVIHYVTQSLNPGFPGSEQLRHAELDGHTLVLSGKDEAGQVIRYHSLVWHRVPSANGEAAE